MNYLTLPPILLFYHLLAWNRLTAYPLDLDLQDLYKNKTLSPALSSPSELHYAEGGVVNDIKIESTSPKLALSPIINDTSHVLLDLLDNGVPQSGTSKVKPRKEAPPRTIVARKGAPPCLENDDLPCTDKMSELHESSIKSPTTLPTNKTVEKLSEIVSTPLRIDLLTKAPSTTTTEGKKPSVTMVLPDSEAFLATLKNDRNVIIPVVALVCTPILVLLALFIYKRIEDSRGNSQYTRMSFLIEDIYND